MARRFASAYARSVYLRLPPRLPGETASVEQAITAAADHVPSVRRRLRPRLTELRLTPLDSSGLRASASISDRRDPAFSVAFTVRRRGGRWIVTSISPPD